MTQVRRSRFDPEYYERRAYRGLGGEYASEVEISDILRLSGPGSTVLEVGVGTGRVFHRLTSQNPYSVGVDLDLRMIKHATDRMMQLKGRKGVEFDFVVADGEHLPFKSGAFDSVVCVRVLRYFNRPKEVLASICDVLRPRGRLLLEFANILRPQTVFQIPQYLFHRELYPHLFTRKEIVECLSRSGMRIERVLGWHKVPVEILGLTNKLWVLRAFLSIESALQRVSPPEFMSRSLVVKAVKR